jgi:hypothetical protein
MILEAPSNNHFNVKKGGKIFGEEGYGALGENYHILSVFRKLP